ncbi:MAG: hypothetical protein SNF33_07710 [Candidatus Algichlamydia australiensis]|nr:hypothetical protein [Chlamydiales bacterium]
MASATTGIGDFLRNTWYSLGVTPTGSWEMLTPSEAIKLESSAKESCLLMSRVQEDWRSQLEECKIKISNSRDLTGYLLYPDSWDRLNKSKCVVFNTRCDFTIAQQFNDNGHWTAARVAEVAECPVLLYDYAGSGLNYDVSARDDSTSLKTSATYQSIVVDGVGALSHAFDLGFKEVINWGIALGGGVAACATQKYLEKHPDKWANITVVNHDSFTITPLVYLPNLGWVADRADSSVKGSLDAATPMKKLAERGVKILILYHEIDCVIPEQARMKELFWEQTKKNLMLFCFESCSGTSFTDDIIPAVRQRLTSLALLHFTEVHPS